MKKELLLGLALIFVLAGCSASPSPEEGQAPEGENQAPAEEPASGGSDDSGMDDTPGGMGDQDF